MHGAGMQAMRRLLRFRESLTESLLSEWSQPLDGGCNCSRRSLLFPILGIMAVPSELGESQRNEGSRAIVLVR